MAPSTLARQPVAPTPDATEWMTVKQAAAYVLRHPQYLYDALREHARTNGKRGLRGSQTGPGACWRIRFADLEAWMNGEQPKKRRPA